MAVDSDGMPIIAHPSESRHSPFRPSSLCDSHSHRHRHRPGHRVRRGSAGSGSASVVVFDGAVNITENQRQISRLATAGETIQIRNGAIIAVRSPDRRRRSLFGPSPRCRPVAPVGRACVFVRFRAAFAQGRQASRTRWLEGNPAGRRSECHAIAHGRPRHGREPYASCRRQRFR